MNKKLNAFFLSLLAVSIALEVAFRLSPEFSNTYCNKVFPIIRLIYLPSRLFPFALSESLVMIFTILVLYVLAVGIIKLFKKNSDLKLMPIIVIISRAFIIFIFLFSTTFSASYHRPALSKLMPIDAVEINREALIVAAEAVAEELNSLSDELEYFPERLSVSGMDFREMSLEVEKEVKKACNSYHFLSRGYVNAKPFALSEPLTYMHIAGIYTFFTGEPCANTNYAEYTLPFTMAHEYSHQCGIGHEDEADFTAFLILSNAEHPYLRYSAYAEAFSILSRELYPLSPDEYRRIVLSLPSIVRDDYSVSSSTYAKYSESKANEVAKTVNDAYLKANGVEEGIRSYNQSVILLTSYLNERSPA